MAPTSNLEIHRIDGKTLKDRWIEQGLGEEEAKKKEEEYRFLTRKIMKDVEVIEGCLTSPGWVIRDDLRENIIGFAFYRDDGSGMKSDIVEIDLDYFLTLPKELQECIVEWRKERGNTDLQHIYKA